MSDPTQEKRQRLTCLLGTLTLLEAYTEVPELLDTEELQTRRDDLAAFLREELARYTPDPKAVPTDKWYREQVHVSEGELECDEGALVSRGGDPGAYVQTWTWIAAPTCTIHPEVVLAGDEEDEKVRCPQCDFDHREDGWGR